MSNFDLSSLALKAAFPTNSILTDGKGLPSVMVYIPKFKMSDVIAGGSDSTHPAFIVDGVETNGIYISKYQNKIYDGRAYSLPGEDPTINISFDTAVASCSAKGAGWHLMTAMEWGAIALWCKKNGFLPLGNNYFGKDLSESNYRAVPTYKDDTGKTGRVATGTGPVSWSHNNHPDGIYDLNGNVWEWNSGMRLVYGELQVLEYNNAANSNNSQTVASAQWKAIDGTTGEYIEPDGNGTTVNSLKLDNVANKLVWITGNITIKKSTGVTFASITADDTVCDTAKEILHAIAMLPDDVAFDYENSQFYVDTTQAERSPFRGSAWMFGTLAGIFSTDFHGGRTDASTVLGFRSAYYDY